MIETAQKIVLIAILAVAAVFDAARGRIPNKLIIAGFTALTILILARLELSAVAGAATEAFLGLLAGGAPLFIIAIITKGGMGGGDMKLMALTGAFVGPTLAALTLCAAVVLAGVYAAATLVLRFKTLKSRMVFGPFIAAAGILAVVCSVST
jgi:leader peptidase (prepilin peptidase)/N-methyltransferase